VETPRELHWNLIAQRPPLTAGMALSEQRTRWPDLRGTSLELVPCLLPLKTLRYLSYTGLSMEEPLSTHANLPLQAKPLEKVPRPPILSGSFDKYLPPHCRC
jgi:hypothetical protein